MSATILVFDSGVGGLTVLREVARRLPADQRGRLRPPQRECPGDGPRMAGEDEGGKVEHGEQQAADPEFHTVRTLYIGPDRAAVISGKPDGVWYYRMRTVKAGQSGPWSEPLAVTVSHHSLGRAVAFFTLGVVIFLGILAVVIRGARHSHGRVEQ